MRRERFSEELDGYSKQLEEFQVRITLFILLITRIKLNNALFLSVLDIILPMHAGMFFFLKSCIVHTRVNKFLRLKKQNIRLHLRCAFFPSQTFGDLSEVGRYLKKAQALHTRLDAAAEKVTTLPKVLLTHDDEWQCFNVAYK